MNSFIFIILSFTLILFVQTQNQTILSKSDGNQVCTYPGDPRPTVKSTFQYPPDQKIVGADWIWEGPISDTCVDVAIIQQNFTTFCNRDITIQIVGDFYFKLWINDQSFLGQYPNKYKFTVKFDKLKGCGKVNTLRVHVTNDGKCTKNNPAGVTYMITQNTTDCFQCLGGNQIYNYDTCACQCKPSLEISACCQAPMIYRGFPYCDCGCEKPKQSCQSKGYGVNSYFDQNQCVCNCLPKVCSIGFYFNQSICSCQICVPLKCKSPIQYYNALTCRCENKCAGNRNCGQGFKYNYDKCKCERDRCRIKQCFGNEQFSMRRCRCVRLQSRSSQKRSRSIQKKDKNKNKNKDKKKQQQKQKQKQNKDIKINNKVNLEIEQETIFSGP